MSKIEFGFKGRDILTGFEGIITERYKHITGCDRVALTPADGKDGKLFNIDMIEIIDEGVYEKIKDKGNKFDDIDKALYNFGDKCKDEITEFEGKIISIEIAVSGDISYALSPRFSSSNRENNSMWVDEGRVKLIKKAEIEINTKKERVGGAVPSLKIR